jgi:hypothetical protein
VVFDALILLAVLSDHMNALFAKHIDLAMPFDGLIIEKATLLLVIVLSKVMHAQLHGVYIYNHHEYWIFFIL